MNETLQILSAFAVLVGGFVVALLTLELEDIAFCMRLTACLCGALIGSYLILSALTLLAMVLTA